MMPDDGATPKMTPEGDVGALPNESPMLLEAVKVIGHTGATQFAVRWSDGDNDDDPIVWIALSSHERDGGPYWSTAAAFSPEMAAYRLAEKLVDGGLCVHCARPSAMTLEIQEQPMEQLICWLQWDPELSVFRRGCA